MKINIRKLIISIVVPLFLGSIVGFITSGSNNYSDFVKPDFAPPGILFPIVWTILYILMGISYYLVSSSKNIFKKDAESIYIVQLIVNLLWSFLFFTFKWYFVSFIWILLLVCLVVAMIKKFYDINKVSGLIQIPYLLWIIFASILNLSIYILNK